MKVIKMINTNGLFQKGYIYCISNDGAGDNHSWTIDENGMVLHNQYLSIEDYVDVVGNPSMGEAMFYNSDLSQAFDRLSTAFQSGMVTNPPVDYDQQNRDREMTNFFREMTSMMRTQDDALWDKKHKKEEEQRKRLEREITITPYTEKDKLYYYLVKGIANNLRITYKKVG